ncbi:MAG: MATE family efflux transporter [Lachnospiraceae bacterium]|nr:MATE family efflux transporter [Lachnospiraceae bacterium]
MVKDMTQGSPRKLILSFAVPLLLGNLFQQFYSLVDTIIVGRFLGVNELAAVGATGSINFLIIGFCMGICSGFGIPIAQKFGARDESGLRRFVANSAWLGVIVSAVMTVTTVLLCRQILIWMKTPADIIDSSYSYIVIIFAGIPVTILYNLTSSIIRSMGDSKTPVYFLTLSAGLNIVLDLFCILVLKMGVSGAAVATVVSQGVSGICCLIYMIKKYNNLRMTVEERRVRPDLMKKLIMMGVPMGLQYSVTAIGSVVLQSAVNTLGSAAVASVTAAGKVSMLFSTPFDALGATMATYAGQNMGAERPDRIRKGLKEAAVIGSIYAAAAFLVLSFAGKYVALLFVDATETAILENVQMMLTANSAFYIPLLFVNIVRFLIQGVGFSGLAVFAGVSEMIARALAGFLLVPLFGFKAVCFANPLAWVFADLFLIPAYLWVMKRVSSQVAKSEN